jgi:hypothetical protein
MRFQLNRRDRRRLGVNAAPMSRIQRIYRKVGRNDPCPCGSGMKFKHCECYAKYGESKQYFTDEMLEEAAKKFNEEHS